MLVREICRGSFEIEERWRATPGSRIARREGFEKPREGPGQGRQRAGTTWADPVGVALPNVPEKTVRWRGGIARGPRGRAARARRQ